MIILKANSELKVIFNKLINTMGRDFRWTEMFVVNDNSLLLTGKDSVLIFDFGKRIISSSPVEMNLKEESVNEISNNVLMVNVLYMTLYIFGKWGRIKGLTVEKDYRQLNELFGKFLNEIDVESVLMAENLRFYKRGIQITYEDIIQEAQKSQVKEEAVKKDEVDADPDENNKYNIGLWHKMVWISNRDIFEKEDLSERDKNRLRIGNNFYMVKYKCPVCGEKLFMVVYPEGKEILIDTDEKGVYLSRAYTCQNCHRLYTPKPHMLLLEGEVYLIDFEEDNSAFDDYLELIGKQGEKTSNCNFNEYEADYNKKKSKENTQLEEICKDIDSMSEKDMEILQDKMDSGFYTPEKTEEYYKFVSNKLKNRKLFVLNNENVSVKDNGEIRKVKREKVSQDEVTGISKFSESEYKMQKKDNITIGIRKEESVTTGIHNEDNKATGFKKENSIITELQKEKTDKNQLKSDDDRNTFFDSNKENNIIIDNSVLSHQSQNNEKYSNDINSEIVSAKTQSEQNPEEFKIKLLQKVEDCKEKNYINIIRVMDEINKEDCNVNLKDSVLNTLKEMLHKRGVQELNAICSKIPSNINKAQYKQYQEVIEQYKEIDTDSYMDRLDLQRDEAEKKEIAAYIKKAKATNRNSLMDLYNRLKKEDYVERNVTPFLENIYDKIYTMDEMLIKKLCPDPAGLSFEEGLQAYNRIVTTELLVVLKTNVLGAIDKRLTKIKMNECEQLINKLSKDINNVIPEQPRIHFYDVRKGLRNDSEGEESKIINKALNTYASERSRYEFPILICDTSAKANGGRGFVLTPDHIYYNTIVDSGVIDITTIKSIFSQKGIIKGIYVDTNKNGRIKISNPLKLHNLKSFVTILKDFITYLKDKPESRDISYMMIENHSVKCCYRCGYVYKGDKVCPKCGAGFNE